MNDQLDGGTKILDREGEARRLERQRPGRQDTGLDHVAATTPVVDEGPAFGVDDQIMRDARQREVVLSFAPKVGSAAPSDRTSTTISWFRDFDRVRRNTGVAGDERVRLERRARRHPDGGAVGKTVQGRPARPTAR